MNRLRTSLFSSVLRQDVAFFDKTRTGELINRLSSDTALLGRSVTENLSDGLRAGAQASVGIGMMVGGLLLRTCWLGGLSWARSLHPDRWRPAVLEAAVTGSPLPLGSLHLSRSSTEQPLSTLLGFLSMREPWQPSSGRQGSWACGGRPDSAWWQLCFCEGLCTPGCAVLGGWLDLSSWLASLSASVCSQTSTTGLMAVAQAAS